jgi:hypothetical protein
LSAAAGGAAGRDADFNLRWLSDVWADAQHDAPVQAAFLNTQTPPGALIKRYNSELFVLLDRPYHYHPIRPMSP